MTNTTKNNFQPHPFHLVSPSPWPLYTCVSLLTLTTAGVLTMHGFTYADNFLYFALVSLVLSMSFWFRDVISEYTMLYIPFVISIIKASIVTLHFLIRSVAFVIIAERKTMASMQRILVANITESFGLLQAFADALKLLLKEYISPTQANLILFLLGPIITLILFIVGINFSSVTVNSPLEKNIWDIYYSIIFLIFFIYFGLFFFNNKYIKSNYPLIYKLGILILFFVLTCIVYSLCLNVNYVLEYFLGIFFRKLYDYIYFMRGYKPSNTGFEGSSSGGNGDPQKEPGKETPKTKDKDKKKYKTERWSTYSEYIRSTEKETKEQKNEKRRNKRANIKSAETKEEREERLAPERERIKKLRADIRSTETEEQKEERLAHERERIKNYKVDIRSTETEEQKEERLVHEREINKASREKMKPVQAELRSMETEEQKNERLAREREINKVTWEKTISTETEEKKINRVARNNKNSQEYRIRKRIKKKSNINNILN